MALTATMTDSSIMMTGASEEVLSVAEGLPAVESAEDPGDLASHGERDTTLATQASEKATTQATQATEKAITQATQVLEKATTQASEKVMDTE